MFLDSPWAKQALEEATRQFLQGEPASRQQREQLHKAAPQMYAALAACVKLLGRYHETATGNRTRDRINEVLEQACNALAEANGQQPTLAD